jgi:hypothetical protein
MEKVGGFSAGGVVVLVVRVVELGLEVLEVAME